MDGGGRSAASGVGNCARSRGKGERPGAGVTASRYGPPGGPAAVHPHLFRHARVRQIVRTTKSLPIAQKQAGWSRLQMAYLTVGEDEVREAMRTVEH